MSTLKIPVTSKDHVKGNENAPITLIEYGDYQCPYCRMGQMVVKILEQNFDKQLRIVFRHFPLTEIHEYAEIAAETAEFAASHHRFWEIHDQIYENQKLLSPELLIELTHNLGLSVEELKKALEKRTYEPIIRNDFMSGVRSGVNGTPTFFLNDQRYDGSVDPESMSSAIEALLSKQTNPI